MGSHAQRQGDPGAQDAFFSEHGFTSTPRLVQWMMTLRCPLSCPHCLVGDAASGEMTPAQVEVFVEELAALEVEEVLLTGGEPLAHPDLPEVIDLLGAHDIPWSLNTAKLPDERCLRAMERHPPGFVAVSLDGPADVHDRLRGDGQHQEALASIRTFAKLAPGRVAAGTTVTRDNFPHLAETFGCVLNSGASQWGLHLVVPEGHAASRPDLMLDRAQTERLLAFVIAKRSHFPVVMADEIGFCGSREPLLRDTPFFCGAGRAGCVVLPDGEVEPCTTTDRSCSAGNVTTTSLAEIWRTGFAELRSWKPEGECAACAHAERCQGGCWLQRRHDAQCFREVWHAPRGRAAAGVALALGLATASVQATARPPRRPPRATQELPQMELLQRSIVSWYGSQVGGRRSVPQKAVLDGLRSALPADPGAAYFSSFASTTHPTDLAARGALIRRALETEQRSLCLIGLAWRDVAEWALDGPGVSKRTRAEQVALRELMALLGQTAATWRRDVFRDKLDPFLRRPNGYRRFFVTKAGPPPSLRMERSLAMNRGWAGPSPATEQFLEAHPHAEVMKIDLEVSAGATVELLRAGTTGAFDGTLRVFDILRFYSDARLSVTVAEQTLTVDVPAGLELLYADVLRAFHEQNPKTIESLAATVTRRGAPQAALPLVLPVLRQQHAAALAATKSGVYNQKLHNLTWWLIDIYLF